MADGREQAGRFQDAGPLSSLADKATRLSRWCIEHPALIVTMGYVYVSALGMAYQCELYSRFGVNILDFSETTDFLVAALRHPVTLLLSFFYCCVWAAYPPLMYWLTSPAWDPSSALTVRARVWSKVFGGLWPETFRRRVPAAWSSFLVFVSLSAWGLGCWQLFAHVAYVDARRLTSDKSALMVVELKSSAGQAALSTTEENVSLVGSTRSYAFFYDHDQECVHIIPIDNILRIYRFLPKTPYAATTPTAASDGPAPTAVAPRGGGTR